MKLSIKQRRANKKAWQYFRELVNDDEKYFSFKNKGTPLEINGSDGGKYYLYPSGKFARISDDEPRLGSVNFGRDMPEADYFSTLFVWITKNEKVFKEKFGCGSISAHHRRQEQADLNPYIPADFITMARTYSDIDFQAYNATTHPIIELEDDYNNLLGIATNSANENDEVCVVVAGGWSADTRQVSDGSLVVTMRAKRYIHVGDFLTTNDVECVAEQVGGETENGEN